MRCSIDITCKKTWYLGLFKRYGNLSTEVLRDARYTDHPASIEMHPNPIMNKIHDLTFLSLPA